MTKGIVNVVVMFSFVVVVVIGIGTNNTAQSDKVVSEKQQKSTSVVVNMTDEMKFRCIQIDAIKGVDQIKDKEEQQAQCKKFLDNVSIYELKELIDKYIEKK